MNGLCTACKQPVEVVDFRLGEGLLVVRCPSCNKVEQLAVSLASGAASTPAVPPRPAAVAPAVVPAGARPPRPAPPLAIAPAFEAPEGFCPKCVARRAPKARSCPACGLVFGKAPSGDVLPSAALAAAFAALAGTWDDPAAHARFLQVAADTGGLAAAGRLYRIRLAQAPEDAVARASLESMVKRASAAVSVAAIRSAPEEGVKAGRRTKLILAAITFFGPSVAFALYKLLVRN